MKQFYTTVMHKGQVTLPVEIRHLLNIKAGDRIAVSLLASSDGEEAQIVLKPLRSVAEMTFGAIPPLGQPKDLHELRAVFEEEMAERDYIIMLERIEP